MEGPRFNLGLEFDIAPKFFFDPQLIRRRDIINGETVYNVENDELISVFDSKGKIVKRHYSIEKIGVDFSSVSIQDPIDKKEWRAEPYLKLLEENRNEN